MTGQDFEPSESFSAARKLSRQHNPDAGPGACQPVWQWGQSWRPSWRPDWQGAATGRMALNKCPTCPLMALGARAGYHCIRYGIHRSQRLFRQQVGTHMHKPTQSSTRRGMPCTKFIQPLSNHHSPARGGITSSQTPRLPSHWPILPAENTLSNMAFPSTHSPAEQTGSNGRHSPVKAPQICRNNKTAKIHITTVGGPKTDPRLMTGRPATLAVPGLAVVVLAGPA